MNKLHVLVGQPRSPQVTPVVGQLQIKLTDFVNEFTKLTNQYDLNLTITVKLQRSPFIVKVCPPSVNILLYSHDQCEYVWDCFVYRGGHHPLNFASWIGHLRSIN